MEQRNSTEGMTQLELVGFPTMESEEDEESGELEEESDKSEKGPGESDEESGK